MKKGEKLLFIYGIIVLLILLFNSFVYNFLAGINMSIFIGLCLIIFKVIFGFEKSNFRVTKESVLDTLIVVLVFLLLFYLFGLLIGFAKTGNYFTFGGMKNYVIPVILTTIFKEIIRYNYLVKSGDNKKLIIFSFVVFVFVDLATSLYYGNFSDMMHIFKFTALSILPAISYNIYATYVSYHAGYKSILIYGIIIGLYGYIIPIIPNADEYLTSLIRFLLPVVLLYRVYSTIKNESDEQIEREYNKKDYVTLGLAILLVGVLVYFSSGYFKYHAVAIATGSMAPSINRGDVAIVKKTTNYDDINVGDILAYEYHNILVIHRVSRKVKVEDGYYFYTIGDANETEDNYIIKQDMIEGTVKYRLPFIGMPTVWLNEMWEE